MKKYFFSIPAILILSCAPASQETLSDRISGVEIKLTRVEQKQSDLEKDIEKTNERIDRLTELISELRLEIEKLRLRLGGDIAGSKTGGKDVAKTSPEPRMEEVPGPRIEIRGGTGRRKEDAETAYRKAIELYSVKKLYEARDAFLNFIKKFPENRYTDNAFFWIGKIYQELGDSQRAERVYKSLAEKCDKGRLPDCNKLPDAYLQLMKIYIDRGDVANANKYYSILMERFPTSDAAVRAREQKLLIRE